MKPRSKAVLELGERGGGGAGLRGDNKPSLGLRSEPKTVKLKHKKINRVSGSNNCRGPGWELAGEPRVGGSQAGVRRGE